MRSAKTCLHKVLGKASLTFEELQTLICEVETVTNSRPLTYVHAESSEPSSLTPAHFLTGQRLTMLPSYPLRQLNVECNKVERTMEVSTKTNKPFLALMEKGVHDEASLSRSREL